MDATSLIAAQKVDGRIVEILATAPSVAIYGYNAKKTWEKSEHEGALLICRRNAKPQLCFIILNQLKPQNFIQYLDSSITLQRKHEYLLYKAPSAEAVQAIWFYNETDCLRICDLIRNVVAKVEESEQNKSLQAQASKTYNDDSKLGKNILNILSNAQKKFEPQTVMVRASSQAQADGGLAQLRPAAMSAGVAARPLQQTSSIPVDSLFQNIGQARNGGSEANQHKGRINEGGQTQDKEKTRTGAKEIGMAGVQVRSAKEYQAIGKGRGRMMDSADTPISSMLASIGSSVPPQTIQPMAPMLQRLLTVPGDGSGDQQRASSAFTTIAPRQNQSLGPANNMLVHLESPVGEMMGSLVSPVENGPNMGRDLDLLTPADLGAAVQINDRASRISAGLPSSSVAAANQSQIQGISPSGIGTSVASSSQAVEQFRQSFMHMLEHNPDFVQRLYDLFVQESARCGQGSMFGSSQVYRKS